MAIHTHPFSRGGKEYKEYIGTDAAGQSVHYIEEVAPDPVTGLQVLWQPGETVITRGEKGSTAAILTSFERLLVAPSGELMKVTGKLERWYTNQQDISYFVAGFGMPIMMSEMNLFVRRGLGFNQLPVWNPATGQVMTYTEAETEAAPTHDYDPAPPANPVNPA